MVHSKIYSLHSHSYVKDFDVCMNFDVGNWMKIDTFILFTPQALHFSFVAWHRQNNIRLKKIKFKICKILSLQENIKSFSIDLFDIFYRIKWKKNIITYSIYFGWTLWEQGKLLVVSYHVPQAAKSIRKSRSKQCSKYDLLNVLNAYMTACVQVHATLNIDCARFLSMHIQLYYPGYTYISIIL